MVDGIVFNGKHSFYDMNLTMPTHPQIQFPKKNKKKTRVPGTNILLDHDEGRSTQEFSERVVTCTFNVVEFENKTVEESQYIAAKLANWLMAGAGRKKLELDIMPYWHFMAEVEEMGDWETDLFEFGEIEVNFICYPFRIYNTPEGASDWDTINFDLDTKQQTFFKIPPIEEQLPFRELKVGDMITIGGWAQYTASGGTKSNARFYNFSSEMHHEIIEIREQNDVDFGKFIFDGRQYKIETGEWIRAQDVVQARTNPIEVSLYHSGSQDLLPEIMQVRSPDVNSTVLGITIERDNNFYNFRWHNNAKDFNDKFPLRHGLNKFKIYGNGADVTFRWHKEMI